MPQVSLITSQKRLMTSSKLKIGQKNAQILESDFGKPQNWESFLYLSNLKFLGVICDKI